jgi:anaerobic magnesium-protoporphyrin IX monomethyl ester cyclase
MRVLLVGPEFEENLSLRYLAAALRQAGHTARLARFDSPEYTEGVVEQVLREQPGIVGLSMVFQVRAREFYALARALRAAGYRGHITAGGHFATFACAEILRDLPEMDSIIRQEGEASLVELADALADDGRGGPPHDLAAIPGLVARGAQGEIRMAPPRHQTGDLDSLPFPARDTPPELHLGVPTAFLVSSRGCYADCDYCSIFAWHEAASGKRYRLRAPASIGAEMAWLYHERGIRFFVFHDDNFFLPTAAANRKRFEALRGEFERRGLEGIGLMLKLRPNDCDHDNLRLLKEIGLLRVFVGIENASGRQLRSLGRDSTVEDAQACLDMLREMGIYATFNILLFDPYTTLDDVAANLRFMRANLGTPFNWCKVEPYAGTALLRRYAQEGRLRGDYLGHDYAMDDPRARLLYDLLLPASYYRNFDYYGLANTNIGLGYHRQLLRHFYPDRCAPDLWRRAQAVVEAINGDTLSLLERALAFARKVRPDDRAAIARFGERLKRDSFRAQHRLSARAEAILREIERAAGVRVEAPVGRSEAFRPLAPSPPGPLSRRSLLAVLTGGLAWVLAGCGRRRPVAPETPLPVVPKGSPPQGFLRVAPGSPTTVAGWEPFTLEAVLLPEDAQALGEARVTRSDGEVRRVEPGPGRRTLRIEYLPGGGSRNMDPNVTVTVAWTVRGKETDSVVMARAFLHVRDDGSYAFGYETPRPTMAEMAAPPIGQGPQPGSGK